MKQKKKLESPYAGPSEPKLGNVTTGLQGHSLNWIANLTVPICTSDAHQEMLILLMENAL